MSSNPPQPFDPNDQYPQPVDHPPYYPPQNGFEQYGQQSFGPQVIGPQYQQQPYGQQPFAPPYGQQPYAQQPFAPPYGQQPYGSPYYPGYLAGPVMPLAPPASKGLSIAALVTGILGFVLSWFPLVGVVLAALGIIFGAIGLQRDRTEGRGLAVAGLILGVLGALLFVVFASAWW